MPRFVVVSLFLALAVSTAGHVEEFDNLDNWEPLIFPNISRHSTYTATTLDRRSVVELRADTSASGMISKTSFFPGQTPYLTFSWKIDRVLPRGNATTKQGDDYPVRIYVAFTYNPRKASFTERITFKAAKLRLGEFPPHSSLNYVWANHPPSEPVFPNPHTDRASMIPLDAGPEHVGTWRTHTVNVLEDYYRAFGEAPPEEARLAIMIDTDNTGDRGTSWIDFIQLSAEPPVH